MSGWTPEQILEIQQIGRYNVAREHNPVNDGRQHTNARQQPDARWAEATLQPFPNLTQPHMVSPLFGETRHRLHVRVLGEEFQVSPPWDEYGIQAPRNIFNIDTRTSIRQAPVLEPLEFRTWEFAPDEAAAGG